MSDTAVGLTYTEAPVYLRSGEDMIFGIVTLPRDRVPETGLIILPGAGMPLTTNRNRMSVRICRGVAEHGYAGLRIDYHGVGDSGGSIEQFRLDKPFVRDVAAGIAHLRELGVRRFVLAGSCFGARTALASAAELDGVEAVILVAISLRDYAMGERKAATLAQKHSLGRYALEALRPSTLLGLFNRRRRRSYAMFARNKVHVMLSRVPGLRRLVHERPLGTDPVAPSFEKPLRTVTRRGLDVRFIYGQDDGFFEDEFMSAARGQLADVLDEDRGLIHVTKVPGKVHGFTTVSAQDAVVDEIVSWVAGRASKDGTDGRGVHADGSSAAAEPGR